jgi:hypothetical protein
VRNPVSKFAFQISTCQRYDVSEGVEIQVWAEEHFKLLQSAHAVGLCTLESS